MNGTRRVMVDELRKVAFIDGLAAVGAGIEKPVLRRRWIAGDKLAEDLTGFDLRHPASSALSRVA
jgi:hypothetical protein